MIAETFDSFFVGRKAEIRFENSSRVETSSLGSRWRVEVLRITLPAASRVVPVV